MPSPHRSVLSHCWYDALLQIAAARFPLSEPVMLRDLYRFVPKLQRMFPGNRHVEAKIRQQLGVFCRVGVMKRVRPGVFKWMITHWVSLEIKT